MYASGKTTSSARRRAASAVRSASFWSDLGVSNRTGAACTTATLIVLGPTAFASVGSLAIGHSPSLGSPPSRRTGLRFIGRRVARSWEGSRTQLRPHSHVLATFGLGQEQPSCSCMGQAPRHVRQARQEDGVELVVMVGPEDELWPLVRLPPVF